MAYESKDELVKGRQLKVQRLVIPFSIVGHATASLVSISKDEPALLFIKTEGVDQITAATDGSPSFTSASDANCVFNILVKINESVAKVMAARVQLRDTVNKIYGCSLANTTGLTAAADKIVLNCDGDVALNASNTLNACLELEYVISE